MGSITEGAEENNYRFIHLDFSVPFPPEVAGCIFNSASSVLKQTA